MSGEFRGIQKIIRDEFPKNFICLFFYSLIKFSFFHVSNIRSSKNCLCIVEKLNVFFNTSKRNILKDVQKKKALIRFT